MRREWPRGVALLVLAAWVYAPVWNAGLVWDDALYVFGNSIIRAPEGLRDIWLSTRLTDYYPVTSTLLWLEWQLFGADPAPFHALNALLHALAALVAWRVLRALSVPGAWVAAAAFAVHPVAVEVAAWISETKTTLSFLLFGLSLAAFLRFEAGAGRGWYAGSLALFVLALLAKTSVVMMPCVLLLLAWWRRGAMRREDVRASLPFFAASLVLGLLTVHQQAVHSVADLDVRPEGLASRIAATGWAFWFYLAKLLVPLGLSAVYPRWEVDPAWPPAWLPLAAAGLVAGLAWRWRAGWGGPLLLAGGFYALMLLPVLGLVPFGFHRYSLVADHLQYPAMLAPLALAVAAGSRALARFDLAEWRRVVLALALLLPLSLLARERVLVFRNHTSLWSDTLAKNPEAWVAHYNLGVALDRGGDPQAAAPHYQRTLELRPDHAEAHDALGRTHKLAGRLDEAVHHYRQALALDPRLGRAHNNLANALRARGELDAAIEHYRLALEHAPGLEALVRQNLEGALEERRARQGKASGATAP